MSIAAELNSELENNILAAIRAGGFADVAAAAFGVPRPLFRKWLRWGSKGKGAVYESFAQKVAQAQATARLAAEMQAHHKDPRMWLRAGPGRETASSEGWTTFVRPQARKAQTINLFATPMFLDFLATLRAVLAPYPEALQAVVGAIEATGVGAGKKRGSLAVPTTLNCADRVVTMQTQPGATS